MSGKRPGGYECSVTTTRVNLEAIPATAFSGHGVMNVKTHTSCSIWRYTIRTEIGCAVDNLTPAPPKPVTIPISFHHCYPSTQRKQENTKPKSPAMHAIPSLPKLSKFIQAPSSSAPEPFYLRPPMKRCCTRFHPMTTTSKSTPPPPHQRKKSCPIRLSSLPSASEEERQAGTHCPYYILQY